MDKITLDKTIIFSNQIDKLIDLQVKDELSYQKNNDSMQAKGMLILTGKVLLLSGEESFCESIDVDIYAPFINNINLNDFKVIINDYTYLINGNKLFVNVYLSFAGINENVKEEETNVAEALNNVNQIENINEERIDDNLKITDDKNIEQTNNSTNENVIEAAINIKDNKKEDLIDDNWVNKLFKVSNEYSSFPYK